ncbi:hypothetical protein [Lacticaseibacillus saniviri]|uniref:hypothetical protein n=1 Tax=Lacticaseibacillus saniviri TaxID=931533 RepID=UPI001CDB0723|nr:hypothetical protein [Lacticaseibacillus saniviri]
MATVVSLSVTKNTVPTLTVMTHAYQNGFQVALIVSVILFLPALLLTNRSKQAIDVEATKA